jgi:hypothetical protein
MDSHSQLASLPEKVMHREELNNKVASLKAHRDGLLLDYIKLHPEMSYEQIGDKFGLVPEHVSLIARKNEIRRLRGRKRNTESK